MAVKPVGIESLVETIDGFEHSKTIDLSNLPAGDAFLYAALRHGSIPRRTAPHPTIPGIYCDTRRADPVGPGVARVTLRYNPRGAQSGSSAGDGVTVRISTQNISEETVRDINGTLMVTSYISRSVVGIGGSSITTSTITHRVSVTRPTYSVVFERTENANAFRPATTYSGKVNERPWQGKPRASWLLSIDSVDNGDGTHRFTYSATFNPKTWLAEIRHPVDGVVPTDARVGNGIEFREVYESFDYARLGLPKII